MDNMLFQDFIAISKYCRWIPEHGRRETWEEAVDRYIDYVISRFGISQFSMEEIRNAMKKREVFGSMRALMTAGKALDLDDVAAYNCSYISVEQVRDFSNIMYILMCGTGVGFSCERQHINKLPTVPETIVKNFDSRIVVEDSRQGWANALYEFITSLYNGHHPFVDTSFIRPAGARLKTFGGYASGPEPFEKLIRFVTSTFLGARGRQLKPIEVHDIVCQIAEIVICGGVRRSALISLSDLDDREMALAKSGPWWETAGHRSLSNNSAIYDGKPPMTKFLQEWTSLYDSHSGERGICNRAAMREIASRVGRDYKDIQFGTNPCSEIILRPYQFCNLSTIAVKSTDTLFELTNKIKMATILGTIQSAMTNFTYFKEIGDDRFEKNCIQERLLGVSMTGILDHPVLNGSAGKKRLEEFLTTLRREARITNDVWSIHLNINRSKAITCVKPEGTTSCVAGTASGLHPRYAPYYIRRVRLDRKEAICQFMIDKGFPHEACVMRPEHTVVFEFPIQSPENAMCQKDLSALNHLDLWLMYQTHYCDHKPSITVSYKDSEFLDVGSWVYNHFDLISGISFLPQSDHIYNQAPFQEITKEEYDLLVQRQPVDVDWSEITRYEVRDTTKNSHALACTANGCELI